ncbi:MAG: PAS domain-containing sensor histidine kinase [Burkholderiaceae bacterium]
MPKADSDLSAAPSDQSATESVSCETSEQPRATGGAIAEIFGDILPNALTGQRDPGAMKGGEPPPTAEQAGLRLFLSPKDIELLSSKFDSTYERFASAKTVLESKVAERTEDLMNVQRRLELIIDSISDAVITFDEAGNIESFSRSAEVIFGYSEADVLARPIAGLVPILSPGAKHVEEMAATLGIKADGSPIRIEGIVRSMTFNGRSLFVATIRDITEQQYTRKLLEEQAFLIEKSKSFVLVTNASHEVDWCNPCFEELTGYKKSQLTGQRPYDLLLDKSTDESAIATIRDACRRLDSYSVEVIFLHATGRPFWIQIESHPMFAEDGTLDKYVALGIDITEQKQREEQQADFVSMVSHELRTPLTVVSGALDALEMSASKLPSDMERSLVEMGQRNCAQLSTLIEDLLDINKLEAGVVRFQSQEIDVSDPVRDGIRTLATLADEAGVRLSANYCKQDVPVFLDPQRLLQVVVNLLSNAVKFSKPGGEVLLTLTRDEHRAKIEVTDHGLGIPRSFQGRVFERFARDAEVQAMGKEGFGLGLSICKGLIDLMGGEIYFVSEEGEGSTFTVELPLSNGKQTENLLAGKPELQYEYTDDFEHGNPLIEEDVDHAR